MQNVPRNPMDNTIYVEIPSQMSMHTQSDNNIFYDLHSYGTCHVKILTKIS